MRQYCAIFLGVIQPDPEALVTKYTAANYFKQELKFLSGGNHTHCWESGLQPLSMLLDIVKAGGSIFIFLDSPWIREFEHLINVFEKVQTKRIRVRNLFNNSSLIH